MWKDVLNWETLYEVNENGEVRNKLTQHILVGDINGGGYHRVRLYNKNHIPSKRRFFVHRLVAQAFIPNEYNLPEVNHKDMNKANNHISNLEWVDRKTNERHCRRNGGKLYRPFVVEYNDDRQIIFEVTADLANELNVTPATVRSWLHKRYRGYEKYNIKNISYLQKSNDQRKDLYYGKTYIN